MKHGVKKIKFKKGKDANTAMLRKLTRNFLEHGKLDTTLSRAKILKSHLDRLVYKAQRGNQADKNMLLRHLADTETVSYMLETVGPSFKRSTGFTTVMKLGPRKGDYAEVARLQWVKEVVSKSDLKKNAKAKKQETSDKKESKKTQSKPKKVTKKS